MRCGRLFILHVLAEIPETRTNSIGRPAPGPVRWKGWDMKLFLSALGLMLIFEGIPYFAFPEKIRIWLEKVRRLTPAELRVFGFFSILAGAVLVYLAHGG